jgi:hypothetical protein
VLHPIIVSSLTLPVPRDWNDEQLLRQQLLRVTSALSFSNCGVEGAC